MNRWYKQLKNKPVCIELRFGEDVEELGGPDLPVTLLDLNPDWLTYQWQLTGEIVIVPARDVVCISSVVEEES